MEAEIHEEKPDGFNSEFCTVSCFLEHTDAILFLHRQDHKPYGGTWGLPAGKVDAGESPKEAMVREIEEETGVRVESEELQDEKLVYVRYPSFDFEYYMYRYIPDGDRPEIQVRKEEHANHEWLTPEEALKRELVPGSVECIRLYCDIE